MQRRTEAFERRDLLAFERRDRHHARRHGLAVDEHRARAALRETAAELRGVELQRSAQHVQQRRLRVVIDLRAHSR